MKKYIFFFICAVATVYQARTQNTVAYEYKYQESSHRLADNDQPTSFEDPRFVGESIYYIFDTPNNRCYQVDKDGTYDSNEFYTLDYDGDGVYSFNRGSISDLFLGSAAADPNTVLGDFCYVFNNFSALQIKRNDDDYKSSHFYIRTGKSINARATTSY